MVDESSWGCGERTGSLKLEDGATKHGRVMTNQGVNQWDVLDFNLAVR